MSSWEEKLSKSSSDIKDLDLSIGSKEKKISTDSLVKVCTKFKQISSLNLSGHNLKELPDDFLCFRDLERLDLSKNELKSLEYIKNSTKLKELSLKLNQITCFPKEILKLEKLEKLDISFNNIKQISSGLDIVGKIDVLKILKTQTPPLSLKSLNISYNEISKFPTKIFDFKELQHLDFSRNHLGDDIPKEFVKFQENLKTLILEEIGMTKFPMEILNLFALEKLVLSKNSIKELPTIEKMNTLCNLREIYMNNCDLVKWSSFAPQTKCQILHLNDNNISNFQIFLTF